MQNTSVDGSFTGKSFSGITVC